MRILHPETIRTMVMVLSLALCLPAAIEYAHAEEKAAETEFSYVIVPELGATEIAPGDGIIITSVRGNRQHLKAGGRYRLDGSYALASADSADLAWFATSRGPSGSTPVTDGEHVRITRGSGNFHLEKTLLDDGWLHVSFYVNGHPHGGIYFGEKGFENTVLRKKGWSDFSNASPGDKPDRKSAAVHNGGITLSAPADLAILAYLGDPVPPPSGLDAKYSPPNLLVAFTALSKKQDLRVERLAVDDSEFPFLVYGVLARRCDFRVLEDGLRQMEGYEYGGSVVGITDEGGSYFSLNMIPHDQYPSGRAVDCNRRLMVRLQMLANTVRADTETPGHRVHVTFDHPEKFLDVKDTRIPIDQERERNKILTMFRDYITERAVAYLPEGDDFYISFTDIKLAGQFPPGGLENYRVVTSDFPPIFVFGWAITNRSGIIIKMGTEELREAGFIDLYGNPQDRDPYRFEKGVLNGWMSKNLRM